MPGIRPGEQTARYIDKILMRLTLTGSCTSRWCLLPEFLRLQYSDAVLFRWYVALDHCGDHHGFHMAQLQAYMMSHQYEGLLRGELQGGFPVR